MLETMKVILKNMREAANKGFINATSLENCVKKRRVIGGPAPEIVFEHIKQVKNKLNVG